MAREQDYIDDVTGRYVGDEDPPVLVYLVAGVLGGGRPLPRGTLSPFLEALLAQPVPRLEMSWRTFDAFFGRYASMHMDALAPAFGAAAPADRAAVAWATLQEELGAGSLEEMVAAVRALKQPGEE
ncbi:MAG: hypothetical protein AB7N73_14540 [Gemmatimonadales bacterium]